MEEAILRPLDLAVILIFLSVCIGIGIYCSRRSKSSESYFLAGRKMPGWIVGFSLMATLISSMTFMASPGFAFVSDWRYLPGSFLFVVAIIYGVTLFMPIFRRNNINSAYEYLERRFGRWARVYAAIGYILMQIARLGLVLYTISLAVHVMLGPKLGDVISMQWVIIILGVAVSVYTIAGGLEAVMWTDLLNGFALMIGGLICLPIVVKGVPGGFGEIMSVAHTDGKLIPKEILEFSFTKETVWMMLFPAFFNALWCTEQTTVQRYIAPKTEREAKKAMFTSFVTVVPVWVYFTFIGTAIYVFYKTNPSPVIDQIAREPEKVLPFFVLTQVPAGLAGFVIAGLIAAATSSLDSSINACASTVTNDFYHAIYAPNKDDRHYLVFGRWMSVVFGVVMIALALIIHGSRTKTVQDLQMIFTQVLTAGLFALFILGIVTRRVGSLSALIATAITVVVACLWLYLDSAAGKEMFPTVSQWLPNKFWFGTICNILLFVLAWLIGFVVPRENKDIKGMSIWTIADKID